MKKISKKELNKKLSKAIEGVFSEHNKRATKRIVKHVEASTKLLVKKFDKAAKKVLKNGEQKIKSVTAKKNPGTIKSKSK